MGNRFKSQRLPSSLGWFVYVKLFGERYFLHEIPLHETDKQFQKSIINWGRVELVHGKLRRVPMVKAKKNREVHLLARVGQNKNNRILRDNLN